MIPSVELKLSYFITKLLDKNRCSYISDQLVTNYNDSHQPCLMLVVL